MQSFHYNRQAATGTFALLIAWTVGLAFVSMIGIEGAVSMSLDRGWYRAVDPSPGYWTRSRFDTFAFGTLLGFICGVVHAGFRRYRKTRKQSVR